MACVLIVAGCGKTPNAVANLQAAEELSTKGNVIQAINQTKAALSKEPNNVRARLLLARLLLKTSDAQGAQQALDQGIQAGATAQQIGELKYEILLARREFQSTLDALEEDAVLTASKGLQYKAFALMGLGKADAAIETIDQAVKQAPTDDKLLLAQARLYANGGRHDEARRIIDDLLARDERNPDAWLVKGALLFNQRDTSGAYEAFRKSLAVDTGQLDFGQSLRLQAAAIDLALQLDRKDEATDGLKKLMARAANSPITWYLRARVDMANNNPKDAVIKLDNALKLAPDHVPSRLLLCTALLAQGASERAETELNRLMNDHPESVETRKLLARIYLATNRADEARKLLSNVPDAVAADSQVEYLLAAALLSTGAAREGIAHLEKSAADPSADLNRKLDLASAYIAEGERDKAIALLDALPPEQNSTRRSALRVFAEVVGKDRKQAGEEIDKLLARNGKDSGMHEIAATYYARVGDAARARALLTKAIALAPSSLSARQRLAALDQTLGDSAAAEADLKEILKIDSGSEFAHLALARLAQQRNDVAKARNEAEAAVSAHPESIDARLLLAQLALAQNDVARAQSLLDQAVTVANRNPKVINAAGELLLQANRRDEASERFKDAAATGSLEAQIHIAQLASASGRYGDARRALEAVLAKEPGSPLALTLLADVDVREGHLDAAVARAQELSKTKMSPVAQAETRGDIYAIAGKFDKAIAEFEAAYKMQPTQRLALKQFETRRRGKLPNVTGPLAAWLDKNPNDAAAWLTLAQYHEAAGNKAAAINEYERGLAASRQANPVMLNNLAWLYNEKGDRRALTTAQKAFEMAPAAPSIADTYGWVLLSSGKVAEAEQVLEKAVAMTATRPDPSTADIKYHLALAQSRSGKKERAVATLKDLLGAHPTFAARGDAEQLLKSISN